MVSARGIFGFAALGLAAAGSWYLAGSLGESEVVETAGDPIPGGYYLKFAKILGTGNDGHLLYEIEADYAQQQDGQDIAFQNVRIRYSEGSEVPWILNADTATISQDQQRVILEGHVRAVSSNGFDGKDTEIRTRYLEFEPDAYRAQTDARVQIRIGPRSLMATGMLALLQENRLELKSNVSGKFVP
ncbi:MAG: LPS export ABC transporter periplasmic protein LptC [Woeseia sp.]